jgi:hypothetical protein
MPDNEEIASITYTVKELLSDIRGSLGRLEGKLDTKADRTEVVELIHRIEVESSRITAVETHVNAQKIVVAETKEWHRFIWPFVTSLALVALALLAWLHPVK